MKIFAAFILTIFIGYIGFYTTIIALLSSGKASYGIFSLVVFLGMIIFANLLVFGQFKKKGSQIAFYSFIGIILIVGASNIGYNAYTNSLKVMSTQDVDLKEYEPFVKNNKIAVLDQPSTFSITDDLPKLDGSTALYPIFAAFAQAVYPEKEYPSYKGEVTSSQTSGAWEQLLKGTKDIIFVPEPPERVLAEAERQNIELQLTPIGKEAFVFFVHKNNPIESLTIEQIQKIYAGEITNWKEVGGKNVDIHAFQRPEDSGSQQALRKVMGSKTLMHPPSEQLASGMGGIIEQTAEYENRSNAIGFSFRFFSQDMVQNGKIKLVAINGIEPTLENIQNNTYPIVNQIYAVTTSNNPNKNIQPFIEWMTSSEGQQLVRKTGYTPND